MKILVTGGAGFIGSHLAKRLVKEKYKVIIIDNLCEGKLENIKEVKNKVVFYKNDILNLSFLKKIFEGISIVFHQAALRNISRSVKNPKATNKVNIEGTLNVLLAAREAKVKRVIFASSSSVYGEQSAKILKENLCPNPLSPYALTKLTSEIYLKQFYSLFGLETLSLRYFNVFGPFQDPASEYAQVIPLFITQMLKNQSPTIDWDGNQSRDFIYIDNVVEANLLAMKAEKTCGEVVNVCTGENISINQLFALCNRLLKKSIKPEKGPKRLGDIRRTQGDAKKAQQFLGFKAKIGFEESLKKTIAWFQKNFRQI